VTRVAAMEALGTAVSFYPPAGGPPVTRFTTDGALLAAAFEAGREAVHSLPPPLPPGCRPFFR
jgi:hypothetical protein